MLGVAGFLFVTRGFPGRSLAEFLDHFTNALIHQSLSILVKFIAIPVLFGQAQRRNYNRAVKFFQRLFLEVLFENVLGFVLLRGQKPLIVLLVGWKNWFVSQ